MVEKRNSFIIHFIIFVIIASLFYIGKFEYFEVKMIDNRFEFRGPAKPSNKVVIIGITEDSIFELGGWPFLRSKYAELLEKLSNAGATVVGIDLIFEDPSTTKEDELFAKSLTDIKTVLPITYERKMKVIDGEISGEIIDEVKFPYSKLTSKNQKFGYINTNYEDINIDGILRALPLKKRLNGKIYNSFSLAVTEEYLKKINDKQKLKFLENIEPDHPIYINHVNSASGGIELWSFADFFNNGETSNNLKFFKNKIVLVGPMATGLGDRHHTPLGTVFGIEIHGTIISNLLNNNFLTRLSKGVNLFFIFLLSLLFSFIFIYYPLRIYNIMAFLFGVIYFFLSLLLFNRFNVITEIVPILFLLLSFIIIINFYWLYRRLHLSNKILTKKVEELKALYEISKTIADIENLEVVLGRVLRIAVEVIGATRGSLMLFNEESGKLSVEVIYVHSENEDKDKGILKPEKCVELDPGEGIAGTVFESGKPTIVNQGRHDPRFKAKQLRDRDIENLICVPMIMKDRCIGVINISNKLDNTKFVDAEKDLMEMVSQHAATVIENARLYKLATVDGMTGLYVNRYFHIRLREELLRAIRYNKHISLLMTDIDHFKSFNDTYGHQIGDLVLIHVAAVVKETVRLSDFAARYGGEEFIVILPETDGDGAYKLGERIRERVENMVVDTPKGKLSVTISVGIATYPDLIVKKGDELIAFADGALYHAKDNGRNRVSVSNGEIVEE